ncbi:hypothetical protein TIFTF001_003980 [Ficus carica]|uniref:Uncharacterized protein n=1 Tax=Ficus carica TaxID=3494 RepID=A0AA87ZBA7_FICCA|nr:hypothetical protein TIFTF001_003980 [Ficus carica]
MPARASGSWSGSLLGCPVWGPSSVVREPQKLECLQGQTTGKNASGGRRSTGALSFYRLGRIVGRSRV